MNTGDLFTIDVDAEIAKIGEARLQGSFEVPAALVRRALLGGATQVTVQLTRNRIEVVDDGPPLGETDVRRLDTVLDPQAPAGARHDALLGLEAEGLIDLVTLTAARPRRRRLERRDGRTRIVLEHARYDRPAAVDWLRAVCLHADADVRLEDETLATGFEDAFATAPLPPPLSGTVALIPEIDTARVHLLAGGLVAGHLSLSNAPPFEAAIMPPDAAPAADAAALRRALLPHLDTVVASAKSLLVETAARAPSLPRREARTLVRLVLQALRDDDPPPRRADGAPDTRSEPAPGDARSPGATPVTAPAPDSLRTVPVIPARVEGGRRLRWFSIEDLETLAGADGRLPALDPGAPAHRFALGEGPVLLLDTACRELAAGATGLSFTSPSLRRAATSVGDRLAAAASALRRAFVTSAERLRHPLAPAALGEDALAPDERRVLARLREALIPDAGLDAVDLCRGDGPIRRGRRRLRLPRNNPTVQAAVRVLAENPAYLHPALVALAGPGRVPRAVRATWPP